MMMNKNLATTQNIEYRTRRKLIKAIAESYKTLAESLDSAIAELNVSALYADELGALSLESASNVHDAELRELRLLQELDKRTRSLGRIMLQFEADCKGVLCESDDDDDDDDDDA